MQQPCGIIEDVMVRTDKFIFSYGFVVMNIEESKKSPLILGRPFLKTARMVIDVDKWRLKLKVQDEKVIVNIWKNMQQSKPQGTCDAIQGDVMEEGQAQHPMKDKSQI